MNVHPGTYPLKHMGGGLRQPVCFNGCDVLHLVPPAGALLHLPEQEILRPRPRQHRGRMHPQLGRFACEMQMGDSTLPARSLLGIYTR